jgi:hypothetical protein
MYWLRIPAAERFPTVYPSGFSFFKRAKATAEPPPGLFITTIGWPRVLPAASQRARRVMSVAPPAPHPMIILIGLAGYDWGQPLERQKVKRMKKMETNTNPAFFIVDLP